MTPNNIADLTNNELLNAFLRCAQFQDHAYHDPELSRLREAVLARMVVPLSEAAKLRTMHEQIDADAERIHKEVEYRRAKFHADLREPTKRFTP